MRRALVYVDNILAGYLTEEQFKTDYIFEYLETYQGLPVSLTMPIQQKKYKFKSFPPFFDGLLPEGILLAGLLKQSKIDSEDLFSQLIVVGRDLVGNITIMEDVND